VVIPGLRLQDVDEENFEDNPVEYIRNDMEGADGESRRRAACDLVQGLCVLFKQSVTQLCGGYINTLLQKYQTNPVEYVEHRSLLVHVGCVRCVQNFQYRQHSETYMLGPR
jgi:exportin-2 (importin alpha re-exporter)